jgi:hypothetical protein
MTASGVEFERIFRNEIATIIGSKTGQGVIGEAKIGR